MKITLTPQQKLQLDHHDSTRDGRGRDHIGSVAKNSAKAQNSVFPI